MEKLPDEMLSKIVSYIPNHNDRKRFAESHSKIWYNSEIVKRSRICLNKCVPMNRNIIIDNNSQPTRIYKSFKFYVNFYDSANIFNLIYKHFIENCMNQRINYISIRFMKPVYVIEFDVVCRESGAFNTLILDTNYLLTFAKCIPLFGNIIHLFLNDAVHFCTMNYLNSANIEILKMIRRTLTSLHISPTVNNINDKTISTFTCDNFIGILNCMPNLRKVNLQLVEFWSSTKINHNIQVQVFLDSPSIKKFKYNLWYKDIFFVLPLLKNCTTLNFETCHIDKLLEIMYRNGGIFKNVKRLKFTQLTETHSNFFNIDLSIFTSLEFLEIFIDLMDPLNLSIQLPQNRQFTSMYIKDENIFKPGITDFTGNIETKFNTPFYKFRCTFLQN